MNLRNVSDRRVRELVEAKVSAFTVHRVELRGTGLWVDASGCDHAGNRRVYRLFDDGRVVRNESLEGHYR